MRTRLLAFITSVDAVSEPLSHDVGQCAAMFDCHARNAYTGVQTASIAAQRAHGAGVDATVAVAASDVEPVVGGNRQSGQYFAEKEKRSVAGNDEMVVAADEAYSGALCPISLAQGSGVDAAPAFTA